MISPGLPVLNVCQLAEHWPKWRQYFEIYVVAAYNNEIKDRQKLALFLHCLGPDGIEMINGWFPQLQNFNSPSAMKITFAEVWNRLHLHCQFAVNSNQTQTIVSSDKEKDINCLDVINVVEMFSKFQVDQENVGSISLCDLEAIAEKPNMLSTVGRFLSQGHQLRIDDATISQYPITSNIYSKYAEYVTHLKISSISESDLEEVFAIFSQLSHLTLKHVSIGEDRVEKYPQKLCQLSLINCTVEILVPWLNGLRSSLEILHLENVIAETDFKMADSFDKLKSLTVISRVAFHRQHYPICPALESLYLDVPKGVYYFRWLPETPLKAIILKDCWSDTTSAPYQIIKGYSDLHHLSILNKVDSRRKNDIRNLKLVSGEVSYRNNRSKKSNLILKLNDHCLLHLLKYLPNEDWKSLKEVHFEFERLIDPQLILSIDSQSLKEHTLNAFNEIGRRVTSLIIGQITSAEIRNVLPYFTNLTELEISPDFEIDVEFEFELFKLQKIRKFKAHYFRVSRYTLPFIINNTYCLEHLDVFQFSEDKKIPPVVLSNCIGGLHNLKTLSVHLQNSNLKYFHSNCLPNLEQLTLVYSSAFDVDRLLEKLNGSNLRNITGVPKDSKSDLNRFPVLI